MHASQVQKLARQMYARGKAQAKTGKGQAFTWEYVASLAQDQTKAQELREAAEAQRLADEQAAAKAQAQRDERGSLLEQMRCGLDQHGEPDKGQPNVITVAVRLASGDNVRRRFRLDERVALLRHFLTIEAAKAHCRANPESSEEDFEMYGFELSCTYPRAKLADAQKTFADYGIKAGNVRLMLTKEESE